MSFFSRFFIRRTRFAPEMDGGRTVETDGRLAMSFFRANNSLLHIFYPTCAFDVGAEVEAEGCNAMSFLADFYLICAFRAREGRTDGR